MKRNKLLLMHVRATSAYVKSNIIFLYCAYHATELILFGQEFQILGDNAGGIYFLSS